MDNHDLEKETIKKAEKREKKRKIKMKVDNKKVFKLKEIIGKKA